MFADNRRVAAALGVPMLVLNLVAYGGFLCLAVGGMAQIPALGYVAVAAGVAFALMGLRALVGPPRAVDAEARLPRLLRSSRAIGAFYVVAGVIWVVVAWEVVQGT